MLIIISDTRCVANSCVLDTFHLTYLRFISFINCSTMKFNIETTTSYNSIHPTYHYTEQFANNIEIYHGTKWFGVFLAFISGTFFTISSSLVKAIKNVDPMILLAIRAILQILVTTAVACARSSTHLLGLKGQRVLVQLQGFVGGLTLPLLYYSFRKLPLGDATTIIFSSPVIVITLSFIFLKEPCGLLRIAIICALFAGIILVSKPPFLFQMHRTTPYDVMGYVYAILATLFTAMNIVIMRKCSEVHYSVIVLNLSVWSFVLSIIFFFTLSEDHEHKFNLPTSWFTWAQVFAVAFSGLTGQIFVAKALQIESAGKVSVTRSLDIILAYIVQTYFFGEPPSRSSIIGAILVLISVICMGFEREIYGICDFIP